MTVRDENAVSEQTRRFAECWRESAPSAAEIRRLRARFGLRTTAPPRSRFRVLGVALAQGFVFGGVTLAAAAWIGHALPALVRWPAGDSAAAETEPAAPHRASVPARGPSKPDTDLRAGAPAVAAYSDAVDSHPGAGVAPPDEDPRVRVPQRARAETAPPAPAGSGAPELERPAPSEAPPSEEVAAASGPWARVARALSESDWLRADEALMELAATSDPATRDAAELARAELWIAHGRGTALRASVERLAAHGATPLIRKRAARLLERLP